MEKGCTFRTVRALLQQFCATDDQPILRPFFWRSQTTLTPGSGPSATPRFSPVQYMPRMPLVSYWIQALYSHYVTRCCRAGMVDSGCPRIGVFGAPQNHHHVLENTHDTKHDAPRCSPVSHYGCTRPKTPWFKPIYSHTCYMWCSRVLRMLLRVRVRKWMRGHARVVRACARASIFVTNPPTPGFGPVQHMWLYKA